MNVFISWSGEPSRQIAELLRDWLPDVIQVLKPWVSAKDVDKGASWFEAITGAIKDAHGFGIFCVTPGSASAPWLLFEAGAIGMADRGRVATVLHGLKPGELRPPLGLFQATIGSSKADVLGLLISINRRLEHPLTERQLDRALDTNWERFAQSIARINPEEDEGVSVQGDPIPLLEEILSTVRRIEVDRRRNVLDYDSHATNPVTGGVTGTGLLGAAVLPKGDPRSLDDIIGSMAAWGQNGEGNVLGNKLQRAMKPSEEKRATTRNPK